MYHDLDDIHLRFTEALRCYIMFYTYWFRKEWPESFVGVWKNHLLECGLVRFNYYGRVDRYSIPIESGPYFYSITDKFDQYRMHRFDQLLQSTAWPILVSFVTAVLVSIFLP